MDDKIGAYQVRFSLVDVFADAPLAGNPLAVVDGGERFDADMMRRIAREFNQSETTFVLPPAQPGADWRLRCFTPAGVEVFGAGHNALGAWWWLAENRKLALGDCGGRFTQQIGDRLLPVEVVCVDGRLERIAMTQAPPMVGRVVEDNAALAAALGLISEDLATEGAPAQVVSTGAAHLLVRLRDRTAVARADPDPAALLALLGAAAGQGCYIYSLDPLSNSASAHARFFNPTAGIAEDAATGSAAGPLACYLVARGFATDGSTLSIEQGHSLGRPSLIQVTVSGSQVQIAGRCVIAAEGRLRFQ